MDPRVNCLCRPLANRCWLPPSSVSAASLLNLKAGELHVLPMIVIGGLPSDLRRSCARLGPCQAHRCLSSNTRQYSIEYSISSIIHDPGSSISLPSLGVWAVVCPGLQLEHLGYPTSPKEHLGDSTSPKEHLREVCSEQLGHMHR